MTGRTPNLSVLRATIAEVFGRKVVLWGLLASAAFVTLFGVAFVLLHREITKNQQFDPEQATQTVIFGGVLAVLGLYVASFLACFLAMTVASSSVTAEIDSGVTQAVAVRPVSRTSWYLQRWAGYAVLITIYLLLLTGALLGVARVVSGYQPSSWLGLVGLMITQALFLLTVGMLVSTRLSAMASGVLLFFYFGFAWLGGFVSFIGSVAERQSLKDIGTTVSLIAPSDGIWKAASSYAPPSGINLANFARQMDAPFASFGAPAPAYLAWVFGFLALALLAGLLSYQRRDL